MPITFSNVALYLTCVSFIKKGSFFIHKEDKCCPFPYRLPSGSSTNITACAPAPVWWTDGLDGRWSKAFINFWNFEMYLTVYPYIHIKYSDKYLMGFKFWSSWGWLPKSRWYAGFYKNGSRLHRRSIVFFRPTFIYNFLFRINFKGISFTNWNKFKFIGDFFCPIHVKGFLLWNRRRILNFWFFCVYLFLKGFL